MKRFQLSFRVYLYLQWLVLVAVGNPDGFGQSDRSRDSVPETQSEIEQEQRTEEFFDSLEMKARKNKITRELHEIIVKSPEEKESDTVDTQPSYLKYDQYEGLIIKNIDFVRLDPFGTSIYDTTYYRETWANNFGNALHIKTLKRILLANLLIQEGEKIESQIIADNERIIRDLPYINDVRVLIIPDPVERNYADVVFITKDLWSKAFFPEFKDVNSGKLELWDRNIFGTGNQFQNNIHWDPSRSSLLGYEAFLRNKNVFGSFIDVETYYKNVFATESYGFNMSRQFITPQIKYAGGLSIYKMRTEKRIWLSDTLQPLRSFDYNYTDIWIGRSFPIDSKADFRFSRLNLIISSRVIKERFFKRPMEVDERILYDYQNKLIWLNSVSLAARSYYRSNLIYSYGRTEDIPTGWLTNVTAGKEFSEFDDRLYSALSISYAKFIGNIGYLYTGTSVGGFINRKKSFEQGVFTADIDYFTRLFYLDRYKFRFFSYVNYMQGLNRFPLERINLNKKEGIRGFSESSVYGKQRVTFNLESVVFSPLKVYGFNFVYFGFLDIGFIGEEDIPLNELKSYSGFGIGLRIRNERLVFPTFQLRISFYPGVEDLSFSDYIRFSGQRRLHPENFTPSAPSLLIYE